MDRTAYKNSFNEAHYDRINFTVPKGFKDKVKACAVQNGVSVNEYLFRLLCADMDEAGQSRLAVKNQFGDKEKDILKKMQVASKYYDMIAGVCVDESGYQLNLELLKNLLGVELFNDACHILKGEKVSFPKCPDHMEKDHRNRCIIAEYNSGQGVSIPDLMEKYDLSQSQIYKIVGRTS